MVTSNAVRAERILSDRARGSLLVAAGGICWSLGGVFVRLTTDATMWHIIFYRALAMALALSLFLMIQKKGRFLSLFHQSNLFLLLLGGGFLGASSIFYIISITHTTVANTLFLGSSSPFFAAIFSRIFLREKIRGATWAAIFFAAVGTAVMVGGGFSLSDVFGSLMAICSAATFAAFLVVNKKNSGGPRLPVIVISGIVMAGFSALMTQSLVVSPHDLVVCSLMGLVQVGLGLVFLTLGAPYVSAAGAALLSLMETILGPIWVWIGFGETPSTYTLAGGFIILSALIFQASVDKISPLRPVPPMKKDPPDTLSSH